MRENSNRPSESARMRPIEGAGREDKEIKIDQDKQKINISPPAGRPSGENGSAPESSLAPGDSCGPTSKPSSPTSQHYDSSDAAAIQMPEQTTTTTNNNQEQIDWPASDGLRRRSCAPASSSTGLLYYNREPLKLKDFNAEVRAPMDIEQFAYQAELLLNMTEVSMDNIVGSMLEKVLESEKISPDKVEQAREAIFIRGSPMLIARTIHGTIVSSSSFYNDDFHLELDDDPEPNQSSGSASSSSGGGRGARRENTELKHDQSWLCALCNLSQITRRHMVIARFNQPTNMGENAREVRLFVLIVVPSQEKGTKREVETGRTFATMLTDYQFRQRLLRATNELEFKSLMMLKAQQLAKSMKLKNRHKYALDAALSHSFTSLVNAGLATDQGEPKGANRANNLNYALGSRVAESKPDDDDDSVFCARMFNRNPRTSKLFDLISLNNASSEQTTIGHQMIEFKQPACNQNNKSLDLNNNSNFSKQTDVRQQLPKTNSGGSKHNKCSGVCRCFAFLGKHFEFGRGFWGDFTRRLRHYPSDFRDAFVGPPRTVQKTVATIWFLYFGILLPTIAFSSLNTNQTHGHMGDLRKAIIGQAIGGLCFALLGGQPLVIIMTTAPLCLYTKVIHQLCLDYGFPFPAMYAAVGLWNCLFLIVYSLFGFSKLMKWCTRSTEEIFALFIVVAFITDASKDTIKNFNRFYYTPACQSQDNHTASANQTSASLLVSARQQLDAEQALEASVCRRETSLLFVLLMLGTLWLATTLYKFKKTPYLSAGKRELLADYALPAAVIVMSFVGSFVFDEIYVERFPPLKELHFERAPLEALPWTGVLASLVLGFTLSLLFFMDQNISAAMVNAPQNKLKKGCAYHYDLFVVGILNAFLTVFGLPMMHGVLPHSPLHVRSLADIEERIEEDHLREVIVNCRETRVTAIASHILLLATLLLIPYPIAYIPSAVLNGLFLYMAITSLDGLQIFERILLLFTEQNKYPPNHYIRRCPQRKIHEFTVLQLFQLAIMCLFGFSPVNIVEMFFPVIILLMIPFRHRIVPNYIGEKYLNALDGKH